MLSVSTPTRKCRRPIEVEPLDAPENSTAELAGSPRLFALKVSEMKLDLQGQVVPDMAEGDREAVTATGVAQDECLVPLPVCRSGFWYFHPSSTRIR